MAIHVRSRLWDSSLIAPDVIAVREASNITLEIGARYGLVLFAIVGDHAHVVLTCGRRDAGQCIRAIEAALTVAFGHEPGFRPAAFNAVFGHGHLHELVAYVLGQHRKHGLVGDPLLEGTNLLDLISVRLVEPSSALVLKAALPELDRAELLSHLGVPLTPGTDATRLVEAAAVVSGGLSLTDRSSLAKRTREATARTARGLGLSTPAAVSGGGVAEPPRVHRTGSTRGRPTGSI